MKLITTVFVFAFTILTPRVNQAQNLVPNPSFDDYSICPVGTNQVERCLYWTNFGMSPDYWGSCSGVPGTFLPALGSGPSLRYQYPHTGGCIMGLATWCRSNIPFGPNYRETVGVQLSSS